MTDLIKNKNFSGLSKAFDTDKISQMLEDASAQLGRPDGFTKKESFAPSSLGYGSGTCPRKWYFAFHGEEFVYNNTARQRANMDAGTAAGERIAKQFEAAGILTDSEFEIINEDPPIKGYGDLMINWQGEEMIGEVKTTKQESFEIRAAQMKSPGYQLIQLLIYMYIKKKDKGFFYIENKNTHEVLLLPVKMTDAHRALVERVFEWARTVKKASDDDQMPVRPFNKSSFQCKSCDVFDACWGGYVKGTLKRTVVDPNPGVVSLPVLEIPK